MVLFGAPKVPQQYDITVEDANGVQTRYRSIELISSSSLETNGKATRVWRALELRDGVPCREPVVLKDLWRHGELAQEGEIISSIHESSSMTEEDRLFLGKHLPTVLHHGDVVLHSESSPHSPYLDSTQAHRTNFQSWRSGQELAEPASLPPGTRLGPYLRTTESLGSERRGRRIHYRIVVKEHCTPLQHEKSPTVVFKVLANVAAGRCSSLHTSP